MAYFIEKGRDMMEDSEKKRYRNLYLGGDGIERLDRLVTASGSTAGEIARKALLDYEIQQSLYRDLVRDATLRLFLALRPDELYDPADDPRQEEAIRLLGGLLGSQFAAEGIASAFTHLLIHNGGDLIVPDIPFGGTDA
jgi:hypothetical protein